MKMSMKVCFIYVLLWKCIVLSVKLQIWPNRRLNQFLLKGEQFLLQYCDPSHYKIVFHEWWLVTKDWQICLLVTISLPRTVYAPRESLYLDIGPDHFCFCTPPPPPYFHLVVTPTPRAYERVVQPVDWSRQRRAEKGPVNLRRIQ